MTDLHLYDLFVFRSIRPEEGPQAARIEATCFPPNEACTLERMIQRAEMATDLFLVAADRRTDQIVGFLTGLTTTETVFRDEFFTDIRLHDPQGDHVMLLSLAVLPHYQRRGIATELVRRYAEREKTNGRKRLLLTCLESKVTMYEKFGFSDLGIANSNWGGEEWHEMCYDLACG